MAEMDLTADERKAIATLKRLARRWPETLWLFAGGSSGIEVMRCGENGTRVHTESGGYDPDFIVGSIEIPSDGGDF